MLKILKDYGFTLQDFDLKISGKQIKALSIWWFLVIGLLTIVATAAFYLTCICLICIK